MDKLALRYYPDTALSTPCTPILEVTPEIVDLAHAMRDLMVESDGVGIAAAQVGVTHSLFVVDIWWPNTGDTDGSLFFINPVVRASKATQRRQEGCLSLPGVFEFVERPESIQVDAIGLDGKPFSMEATGLLAVAIHHENDHLLGKVMLDRMGPLTRRLAVKTLR